MSLPSEQRLPNLLTDDNFVILGVPFFKTGVAKVTFPVLPGSGYRIFIDTISATPDERSSFEYKFTNCNRRFGVLSSGSLSDIEDIVHMPSDENHNTDKSHCYRFYWEHFNKTR